MCDLAFQVERLVLVDRHLLHIVPCRNIVRPNFPWYLDHLLRHRIPPFLWRIRDIRGRGVVPPHHKYAWSLVLRPPFWLMMTRAYVGDSYVLNLPRVKFHLLPCLLRRGSWP